MIDASTSALAGNAFSPDSLADVLLDISLTGLLVFRPVYTEPGGPIQDLAYEHLNPAAQRMLRLPGRPTETFLTLYPWARETGIFAFYVRAFTSRQTERYQVNYQHDGLDGFFHLVARRHGELLLVSFTDTNDQPRSAVEEALRESQAREQAARAEGEAERQRLYTVLMQLPAYVAVYRGPDHLYQFVNPNYQRMFPHRSFIGRPFREGMPEAEGLGVVALFDQVYQTGEPYYAHEMEGWFDFHGTGKLEQLFFDLSLQPLRNVRGEVDGVLDFSYDVSEQVLARRQLQHLNQQLESRVRQRTDELAAMNEELAVINEEMQVTNDELHDSNTRLTRTNADLDTFVYTASHDLKAPIANIEGLLLALRHELPVEVLQGALVPHLLELMQGAVARFQQTIGHLTHISQLQRPEAPAAVALSALIQGVQLDLGPLIEAAGATLTVSIAGCETVQVTPKILRSVVYNLLSNALKYRASERPAEVALRARCVPDLLVFEVQDNGLGLSEGQQSQLFGMFKRLHTHVEGSGVGLFMVKRLVENAGGTITVQSQLGVGTTFTVCLPD